MTQRRPKPPGSARAIAAYRCGARMADWGTVEIPRMVTQGESLKDYMTGGELAAFRLCSDAFWWRYWWQGYRYGSTERDE